jgi:peptidyl-prolyl cis-trans isomerase C
VIHRLWLCIPLLALICVSCNRQSSQGREVARVNDQPLTLEMIRQHLDTSRGVSEMQVRMFTNRWVNSELLYQEAKRLGIDNSDQVLQSLEDAKKQLTINALLEKEIFTDSSSSVTADEVIQYFRNHSDDFSLSNDIVWISFVVFADKTPAENFRSSALKEKGWTASVNEIRGSSDMITQSDSVFYTESSLYPPELWKVATALGTNEVSFPVKTQAGYFILFSLGNFSKGTIPPMQYVVDNIRSRLVMEKRQQRYAQYLESLRKRHTVQINLTGIPFDTDSLTRMVE